MEADAALRAISALSNPTRLRIVTALCRHNPGILAGRLAETVGMPRNLTTAHLTVLARAGLVSSERDRALDGRAVRYRVNREVLTATAAFLDGLAALGIDG